MIRLRSLSLLLALAAAAPAVAATPTATLVAYAELPAATFVAGPTAGRWQGAGTLRGHAGPYPGKQPVQGFSGVLADGNGWFTVLVDNGYGALETSADHRLTMYKMKPTWGEPGRPGGVRVGDAIPLSDPDKRIPWTLTHMYDEARPLSGADLDPESFQRMPDGSYWIGDEFGPFLVHVDARGKVLDAPVPLPDPDGGEVRSPQNPFNEESASVRFLDTLRAFGMARSKAGQDPRPIALSPWHLLLADGDPATGAPGRAKGASEIVDVKSLHAAGYQVVPWTVNDRKRMDQLLALGVDGIISDRPDLLRQAVAAYDADRDGKPGDFLDADGNVDAARFDAQGHRGARDLRPESTLPAFEAALDEGMTTLETDCVVTLDRIPVLSHEPRLAPAKTRRLDGKPIAGEGPAIRAERLAALRATYDRAMTLPDRPLQTLDPAVAPVSRDFAAARGLGSIHALLTLDDLFAFVKAYEAHYASGAGAAHPRAKARAAAARRVRFNVETKTSPAEERAGLTPEPEHFVRYLAPVIMKAGMAERTTIQSFDMRTLYVTLREFPAIATAFLLEDALPFSMRGPGAATSKLPYWPWRVTAATRPMRAKRSGGFEALALAPNGRHLYAMMEKPLAGARPDRLLVSEFDAQARRYTGRRWWYPWDEGALSVADFVMVNARQGLAIERDDGEGPKAKLKRLYLVTLGEPGTVLKKELVADLMAIRNPRNLAGAGQPGDVARSDPFGMPFWTIEGVAVLDARHVLILNDNNYPYSAGRHQGTGQPDDDEWAVLELAKPLPVTKGFRPIAWK